MIRSQEGAKRLEELTEKLRSDVRQHCIGIPYGIIQLSVKRDAMCDTVVLDVGTALAKFE